MRNFYTLFFCLLVNVLWSQVREDFRIMQYNLMFYKAQSPPCSHTQGFTARDQAFKTVFKAVKPDILCVNELGAYPDNSAARSVLQNVINTDGETNFTSAEYSNNGFSSIVNMIFYDSTRFALKSQDAVSNQLNNTSLVRVIDLYRLYYKDPALDQGADTVFFTVIAAHLKASNTSNDRNSRRLAVEALMDHLENNVSDQNVILTGDLNVYTSSEPAYQELVNYAVAAKRFTDPLPAGPWNNNSTYASIHTQSTHAFSSGCHVGGGLDDRFDFILHSQAIANGSQSMHYKANSTLAVGNDGGHFNQDINAGTNQAVSQSVADALFDFSDHLPVMADYQVELSDISIGEPALATSVIVSPNPFASRLHLERSRTRQNWQVRVFDLSGRHLFQGPWLSGHKRLEIPSKSWRPGLYLVEIEIPGGSKTRYKIIRTDDALY